MHIEVYKERLFLYIVLLPVLKPGIVNNKCYSNYNSIYSYLRIAVFFIILLRIILSKALKLSHYAIIMMIYEGWIFLSTIRTNPGGVSVWAGPALSVITIVLIFDFYESNLFDVIDVIGNILFAYFVINEISVLVAIIASGNVNVGLSYFNPRLPKSQYFLGMDNRFINYYFPGVLCNILSSRKNGFKYGKRAFIIMFVGGATLISLWAVGGMLGMIILIAVVFTDERIIKGNLFNADHMITMMILANIVLIAASVTNPEMIWKIMQFFLGKGGNYLDRVNMWKGVLNKVFLKYPFAGIGAQSMQYVSYFMRYNHAHNLMMTVLYQGGIIGEILFWIGMYSGCHNLMWFRRENMAKTILGAIVVELFTNFADTTFDVFFVIMICMGVKYSCLRNLCSDDCYDKIEGKCV